MKNGYMFDSVNQIVEHVMSKVDGITPIRIQKNLYFLFAYYGATYGQMNSENEEVGFSEGGSFPQYLFNADFQAWKFGPVIDEVYYHFKDEKYSPNEWIPQTPEEKMVSEFINNLLSQFESVGDFGLVERSHQDKAWIDAYEKGYNQTIDNNFLVNEYVEKYVGNKL